MPYRINYEDCCLYWVDDCDESDSGSGSSSYESGGPDDPNNICVVCNDGTQRHCLHVKLTSTGTGTGCTHAAGTVLFEDDFYFEEYITDSWYTFWQMPCGFIQDYNFTYRCYWTNGTERLLIAGVSNRLSYLRIYLWTPPDDALPKCDNYPYLLCGILGVTKLNCNNTDAVGGWHISSTEACNVDIEIDACT